MLLPEEVLTWGYSSLYSRWLSRYDVILHSEYRWPYYCGSGFANVLTSPLLAGLNYVLTADVAQKEKGQLPRVYFVLLGETPGQISEKLQMVHMEETCRHYLVHVKVSLLFFFILKF
jgi:hypothetical protein